MPGFRQRSEYQEYRPSRYAQRGSFSVNGIGLQVSLQHAESGYARRKHPEEGGHTPTRKLEFIGHDGNRLAGQLDLPMGPPRAYALLANCFTCSKDVLASVHISAVLARAGIAVLRFDFTGLDMSEGEFANTNFSSNVADRVCAADLLRSEYQAPALLVGHSLSGAAVLAVAGRTPRSQSGGDAGRTQ